MNGLCIYISNEQGLLAGGRAWYLGIVHCAINVFVSM